MDDINLTVRIKGDKLILKLGETSKELIVTTDLIDEVTQLSRLLLERRKEILDKRRRDMLQDIKNMRKGDKK